MSLLKGSNSKASKTTIEPMLFRGTTQEIDEGFFTAIAEPVKQTASLFANADAYQKSLADAKDQLDKKAKKASDSQKPKVEGSSDTKKVYEEKMKKVADLDSACKYAEALAELPSAEEYPEKKGEIENRKAELERKSAQLSLL